MTADPFLSLALSKITEAIDILDRLGLADAVDALSAVALDLQVDLERDGQPDEAQEWHDFDPDC